jgi:hypothetical protein
MSISAFTLTVTAFVSMSAPPIGPIVPMSLVESDDDTVPVACEQASWPFPGHGHVTTCLAAICVGNGACVTNGQNDTGAYVCKCN